MEFKTRASAEGIDMAVIHWEAHMGNGYADALAGVVAGWAVVDPAVVRECNRSRCLAWRVTQRLVAILGA
eukprot:10399747-Lingulodinium_polyedra.AAC.1